MKLFTTTTMTLVLATLTAQGAGLANISKEELDAKMGAKGSPCVNANEYRYMVLSNRQRVTYNFSFQNGKTAGVVVTFSNSKGVRVPQLAAKYFGCPTAYIKEDEDSKKEFTVYAGSTSFCYRSDERLGYAKRTSALEVKIWGWDQFEP